MAMSRSFSVIGPSLWNRLPLSARASLLSPNLSTSLSLLKCVSFLGANRTKSASVCPWLLRALYKYLNTIQHSSDLCVVQCEPTSEGDPSSGWHQLTRRHSV